MSNDIKDLAAELARDKRRILDVNIWGQGIGRPDGPESLIGVARYERDRLLLRLDYAKVELPVWLYALVGIDWQSDSPFTTPYDRLKQALGSPLRPR